MKTTQEIIIEIEGLKEEYAKEGDTVDIGNMFHYVCSMQEHLKETLKLINAIKHVLKSDEDGDEWERDILEQALVDVGEL